MPQLLPRLYRLQQQIADERRIAEIILEVGEVEGDEARPLLWRSPKGDDPRRLRGLPAIGRNVSGATDHTDPVRALLRKEARGELRR